MALGLAVRLVFAVAVYPGKGFAGDINLFLQWSEGIAARGPGGFYAGDATANYGPAAIYVLWGLHTVAVGMASLLGTGPEQALLLLIKVPAVLADIGVAATAYYIANGMKGPRVGLVAAGLYLVVPPVWYTSALWGQIDSVLTLFSLAALALLIKGRHELASVAAVCAVLVKPQGALVVLIVGVVLLVRHLAPTDRRFGIKRLLTSVLAGLAAALALIVPFDYQALAPSGWGQVPIVNDVVGFISQSLATSQLFPVLTANAYNWWALVGNPALASSIGSGTAIWIPDSLPVWGLAAGLLGIALLGAVAIAVLVGLVVRHDAAAILFGYVVLSFAVYALPTRSHERYLLPMFATGAVLAAPYLMRSVVFLAAGVVNLVNLHAVLAGPLAVVTRSAAGPWPGDEAPGPPGGEGGGLDDPSPVDPTRATDILLPYGALARADWVVTTISMVQTSLMLGLLIGWVVLIVRTRRPATAKAAA